MVVRSPVHSSPLFIVHPEFQEHLTKWPMSIFIITNHAFHLVVVVVYSLLRPNSPGRRGGITNGVAHEYSSSHLTAGWLSA